MDKAKQRRQEVLDALGGRLQTDEIERFVRHYPSFEPAHRLGLLYGFFEGKSTKELVDQKLKILGTARRNLNRHQIGGHTAWVIRKIKRIEIRLLYLRLRLDEGLTRIEANQRLMQQYVSAKASQSDYGQSNLRKQTRSPLIDS